MVLLILTLAMARAMARAISVAPLALIVRIKLSSVMGKHSQ